MKNVIQWGKDESFEKKEFGRFVRMLAEEAVRQSEGMFYGSAGDEDDRLADDSVYIDLGEYSSEELQRGLEESIRNAKENGLSEGGADEQRRITFMHQKNLY